MSASKFKEIGPDSPFQTYAGNHDSFAQRPVPASGDVSGTSAVVVSAMTALQERIKELEAENMRLADEINELALAEANQKTEAAQRENELGARYSAEITKLNSNLDEKTASLNSMTTRASCAEETIAALRREVDYLKDRVRELDAARSRTEEKCAHSEQRARDLERELSEERRKFDDQTTSIKSIEETNTTMLENAERARQKLAEGLKREHSMRIEQEEKYLKSEEMLRSVIQLNEGLVAKALNYEP